MSRLDGKVVLVSGATQGVDADAGGGSLDAVAAGLDHGLPLRSTEPGVHVPAGPPAVFFMDRFATAFPGRARRAPLAEVTGLVPNGSARQDDRDRTAGAGARAKETT